MKFSECTENLRKGSEAIKRMLPTVKKAVQACMDFNKIMPKIEDIMDVSKNSQGKEKKEYYLSINEIFNSSSRKLGKLVKKKIRQGYKIKMPNFTITGFEITKVTEEKK